MRQPPSAVGATHASIVTPVVSASEAACGTVTRSLTPSNVSAPPKRPLVVRTAPLTVPVFPAPELSVAVAPFGSSNP